VSFALIISTSYETIQTTTKTHKERVKERE
jgi:hypothetical protein